MKKIPLISILFIFSSFGAFAAEQTLSLALMSNYVIRGVTQTNDKTAIQAAYQVSQSDDLGFYAGIFASNVAKGTEVDVYGGLAFGRGDGFILDVGAIQYLYTDSAFASDTHEIYVGIQYDKSYLKYYFGKDDAGYLDIGTGFNILGGIDLLLHFGEVSSTTQNGHDVSVTLQKDFEIIRVGLTATYEDKTPAKESELFAYISTAF